MFLASTARLTFPFSLEDFLLETFFPLLARTFPPPPPSRPLVNFLHICGPLTDGDSFLGFSGLSFWFPQLQSGFLGEAGPPFLEASADLFAALGFFLTFLVFLRFALTGPCGVFVLDLLFYFLLLLLLFLFFSFSEADMAPPFNPVHSPLPPPNTPPPITTHCCPRPPFTPFFFLASPTSFCMDTQRFFWHPRRSLF